MQAHSSSRLVLFLAVAAVVFCRRLPFVTAGYGADNDAWGVFNAGRHFALTGHYQPSRPPGYPIPEVAASLIWRHGWVATNCIAALLSGLAVAFFVLYLMELGCRQWLFGGAALAFAPVVYINSTCTMDYIYGLSFAMGSLYFISRRQPIVAGVLLGAAIGSRITYAAMIVPMGVMWFTGGPENRRRDAAELISYVLAVAVVAAAAFAPAFRSCGAGFFTFVEGRAGLSKIAWLFTEGVWGLVGLLAILAAVFAPRSWEKSDARAIPDGVPASHLAGWIIGIIIYAALFFRLPVESGYLIPIVPFVILLLGRTRGARLFRLACIGLVVSPFVFGVSRLGSAPGWADIALAQHRF